MVTLARFRLTSVSSATSDPDLYQRSQQTPAGNWWGFSLCCVQDPGRATHCREPSVMMTAHLRTGSNAEVAFGHSQGHRELAPKPESRFPRDGRPAIIRHNRTRQSRGPLRSRQSARFRSTFSPVFASSHFTAWYRRACLWGMPSVDICAWL
jgi:hypothetical protein